MVSFLRNIKYLFFVRSACFTRLIMLPLGIGQRRQCIRSYAMDRKIDVGTGRFFVKDSGILCYIHHFLPSGCLHIIARPGSPVIPAVKPFRPEPSQVYKRRNPVRYNQIHNISLLQYGGISINKPFPSIAQRRLFQILFAAIVFYLILYITVGKSNVFRKCLQSFIILFLYHPLIGITVHT